jgi:hypothetical protein
MKEARNALDVWCGISGIRSLGRPKGDGRIT